MQYLHQIGLLDLLPALASQVIVPAAVAEEIEVGRARGIELPEVKRLEWRRSCLPTRCPRCPTPATSATANYRSFGLRERPGSIAVLDDGKARQVATAMNVPFTGTLGLLLDAKRRA